MVRKCDLREPIAQLVVAQEDALVLDDGYLEERPGEHKRGAEGVAADAFGGQCESKAFADLATQLAATQIERKGLVEKQHKAHKKLNEKETKKQACHLGGAF